MAYPRRVIPKAHGLGLSWGHVVGPILIGKVAGHVIWEIPERTVIAAGAAPDGLVFLERKIEFCVMELPIPFEVDHSLALAPRRLQLDIQSVDVDLKTLFHVLSLWHD